MPPTKKSGVKRATNKSGVKRARAAKYNKKKRNADEALPVGDNLNDATQGEITPPEPPKKKGRGPAVIAPVKEDPEQRPEIWRVGPCEFSCAKNPRLITTTITRSALRLMPAPLRSFHAFDDKSKLNLERDILERYRYAKDEDHDRCREVLEAIAGKRYCEELGKARAKRVLWYGWDIIKWKADVPHWSVVPAFWRGLCDIFFTEEWQKVSAQNKVNREGNGSITISHYAGSASAHQHFEKLTTLFNGRKPTMEDLYIHIHCARENGVSPIMAQISTAEEGVTEINENNDGSGGVNPTADETIRPVHEIDVNSLQFTSNRKEEVYRKVKSMRADQANSELDDSTLFMTAIGGPSHGRVLGFGSFLQKKVQTSTTRERQNPAISCVSRLTEIGVQETFSRAEVQAIMQERDRRIEEEHAERIRDQARNELMFSHILKMVGQPPPPTQFEGPTSQATQELPSILQMEFNQDVAGLVQPNQEGPFQALLNSQTAQEIAGNDAAMGNWWANQPST